MNIGRNRRVVSCPCFSGELIRYARLFLSTPVKFGKWFNVAGNINDSLSVQTDCYQTRLWKHPGNKVYHVGGHLEDSKTLQAKLIQVTWAPQWWPKNSRHAKPIARLQKKPQGRRYSVPRCMFGHSVGRKLEKMNDFRLHARKDLCLAWTLIQVHSGRTAYGRRVLSISDVLRCTVVVAYFFWLWFSPSSMLHLVGLVFRLPTWPPWSWVLKNCR